MPQFRPFPAVQVSDDAASKQAQARLEESPITPSVTIPSQLLAIGSQPIVTTGELPNAAAGLPVISTEQLAAIAGGRSAAPATETRIVRIPGDSRKTAVVTEPLAKTHKRMSPRLRHSIIIFAVFFVAVFTLLSLAPLASGQNGLPLFKGIGSWVRSQQQSFLQLESQIVQVAQPQKSTSQQPVNLPPVNLPKSAYVSIAQQDAMNAGISPDYFVRQINLESGFNPNAVSPSGAEGIAQFLPSTAAGLGINPFDPYQALNAAAHVMAGYNANYHGNYAMALAAYNAGSGTVQYAVTNCGSNWMSCLPAQTQNYIHTIMGI